MATPPPADDWVGVAGEPLPVTEAIGWAVRPGCGALAAFCGTVRDHSDGRPGVVAVEYEAYLSRVEPRLDAVASAARSCWPELGRIALLHRVGRLEVGDVSVVVAISAPHRQESFAATRFVIDAVKRTVPIWKREVFAGGSAWALGTHALVDVGDLDGAAAPQPAASPG